MPWARLDDRMPWNRKVRPMSDGAFRLFISAICWSAENLTDGVILTKELPLVSDVRSARKRAVELTERGVWEPIPGVGWRIHDYLEYNPTAEQVRLDRAAKTARQKRWRENRSKSETPPEEPAVDASTDASRDASRDGAGDAAPRARVPAPPRPDPHPNSSTRERAGASPAQAAPPDQAPRRPDGLEEIPDDFALTDAMRWWANKTFPGLDLDHETAQFVSHYRAEGARRKSWPDQWQKWIRQAAKYQATKAQQQGVQGAFLVPLPGGRPLTGTDATVQAWLDLRETS